jgi:hypothetical protein
VSATACVATGGYGGTGFYYELAAIGNGTSWTYQYPITSPGGTLPGVSCTAVTACTAVGVMSPGRVLVERYTN